MELCLRGYSRGDLETLQAAVENSDAGAGRFTQENAVTAMHHMKREVSISDERPLQE